MQTDNFNQFRHEKLDRISKQLIQAKKLLQDVTEPRCQCLNELSLRKEFISWVREALGGTAVGVWRECSDGSWGGGRGGQALHLLTCCLKNRDAV